MARGSGAPARDADQEERRDAEEDKEEDKDEEELAEEDAERFVELLRQATAQVELTEEDLDDDDHDDDGSEAEGGEDEDGSEDEGDEEDGSLDGTKKKKKTASKKKKKKKKKRERTETELASDEVIKKACMRVAMTSFASSGFGMGPVAAFSLGIAATQGLTQLQYEMISDVAKAHGQELTPESKHRLLQVLNGLGTTSVQVASGAAQAATSQVVGATSQRVANEASSRMLIKALPFVGPVASAMAATSLNVTSTYVIGRRAQLYFSEGEEALPSFADSVRILSGVDERKLGRWISEAYGLVKKGVLDRFRQGRNAAVSTVRGAARRVAAAGSAVSKRLSFRGAKSSGSEEPQSF